MFYARTIHPEAGSVDVASYALKPASQEGEAVCALWREFLTHRGTDFRDKIGFLRQELEIEWAAAPGGVALASFFDGEAPLCMGVLLSGLDAEADGTMLGLLRQTVLDPFFPADASRYVEAPERPLLLNVVFSASPEWGPVVQLLSASLASVFFQRLLESTPRP